MQTHLSPEFAQTPEGEEARAIVLKCVHCGFCNATCPTYQLLGDELDGPRGRIYLIKQVLEGAEVTRTTQQHLDRCLTCLNCQTTCPSGVEYGHLVDIGRKLVDARVERPVFEKTLRWALQEGLTSALFAPAIRLGQLLRPLLPPALKTIVPIRSKARPDQGSRGSRQRKMLLLAGCVQPAMMPNINRATQRVLSVLGIDTLYAVDAGCCGAVRSHLGDADGGLADMRRNVDAWIPMLAHGEIEAIVASASACGLAIKEYGHALANDVGYSSNAARVSELARDVSELLPELVPALKGKLNLRGVNRLAFHSPCTLQHGQRLIGGVETHLRALGFDVAVPSAESQMCCGAAGTYSILQPLLANRLRERKLANLAELDPQCIVSANMGCIRHLQSGTATPVRHWIEVLDEALSPV
ncbi:MAG: glycolate oxidase subunit GlcF [Pseudomonadota bacterium]|nr:glycolate oxidase subunit GlcF [Pseudomonadota bacterium]